MAAVTATEGRIIFSTNGDTHAPVGSQRIYTIVVVDDGTPAEMIIYKGVDNTGPVVFQYAGAIATEGTHYFNLNGCVSTGGGLFFEASGGTAIVYVK